MAKHHVFLHVGPDAIALDERVRTRLATGGVPIPDVTEEDLLRADLEIRRVHKAAGFKRKDVEGAWARVCRRTFRLRSDAFLSVPGFWEADESHAALALDGLHGLKVHLVTSGGELPPAWSQRVKPERVHLLDTTVGTFAADIVRLSLTQQKERLDRSLLKLKKRRKRLNKELVGASD